MAKRRSQTDRELAAIGSILQALDGLDGESIQRVLDYVFGRLSITGRSHVKTASTTTPPAPISSESSHIRRPSIRDLKEEKQPESSNQMAALVAYYLSEITDDQERKHEINTADLQKYFKQAGFRLPKSMPQTLSNAAAAGYLDPTGGGFYKLNPVGYNLVVHGLPRTRSTSEKRAPQRSKKKSKKTSR
jgi:hypothetical protein